MHIARLIYLKTILDRLIHVEDPDHEDLGQEILGSL
jgi:hypothetical protein